MSHSPLVPILNDNKGPTAMFDVTLQRRLVANHPSHIFFPVKCTERVRMPSSLALLSLWYASRSPVRATDLACSVKLKDQTSCRCKLDSLAKGGYSGFDEWCWRWEATHSAVVVSYVVCTVFSRMMQSASIT